MDWRKSSYSGANGGDCVAAASGNSQVTVRDTAIRDGAVLSVTGAAWQRFTATLR
jgi:hypothetical protein